MTDVSLWCGKSVRYRDPPLSDGAQVKDTEPSEAEEEEEEEALRGF